MLYYKQCIDKNYCKTYAYQIYKWKKPNIFHMYVFRCKCVELNNRKDNFDKFDAKANKGLFLSYSTYSKSFWTYKRIMAIE